MSIQHPVAVGVDPHADTLTAAAVDSAGHRLWDITVANTQAGIGGLIRRLDGQRVTWAIEGTGTFGRELCDQLLRRGDTVREVPTRLTGSLRRRSGFSKTDRADATTIARAALTEPLARVSTIRPSKRSESLSANEKPWSTPKPGHSTGSTPTYENSTRQPPAPWVGSEPARCSNNSPKPRSPTPTPTATPCNSPSTSTPKKPSNGSDISDGSTQRSAASSPTRDIN
jgi:hypothetical protein